MLKKIRNAYRRFERNLSPQMSLVWGFFMYSIIGFCLLSIPLFHKIDIELIDNLFISTSAISTTGLVTVSIFDTYNFYGQLIIMILIQIGGIGYMTLTTYYLLFTTKRITYWHNKIVEAEFTLPKTIKMNDFIRSIIIFTLVMETLGSIAFYFSFREAGMNNLDALWFAIFHSVSSFCTAGFALFNNSFETFRENTSINMIVSILAIAGSLGFIVVTDLWYRFRGKANEVSFTTRIVLAGFIIMLTIGTLITFITENISFNAAFFQTMSAMTTVGFNTVPINGLSLSILLLIILLMYVGASPSGTSGGMKITTLTAIFSILKSRLVGQKRVSFLKRKIPFERLYVATSTFILYTSIIFIFTFFMSFSEDFPLKDILFEVSSALGTVGLSTGITPNLSCLGKLEIIILMFIGRVGVLTFGFALLDRSIQNNQRMTNDDLAV